MLIAIGVRQQGYVTSQQVDDLMPEDITDRQIYRWLDALEKHGIRIRRQSEDNTCAR